MDDHTETSRADALRAIASMRARGEKAQTKFAPGSWQHRMLAENLNALHMAMPLLAKALGE